jgi:phosphonate transport system substrate-binding protein
MKHDLRRRLAAALVVPALFLPILTSCGSTPTAASTGNRTLRISSIPDQDPDKLAERDRAMAAYLHKALGVPVEFVPVTDYAASVSLFHTGDLDLVFYGGLTGAQARLQTPGSVLIAQRDIDDAFQSVFIAGNRSGIGTVSSVDGLSLLKGRRFTFGAETSTSGRLMPEYFLDRAGVNAATDLDGPPGYSGSHDKTIALVEAGTYEAGALNAQVWRSRLDDGSVDLREVHAVFTTPPYHDYHWLAGPETNQRFGPKFTDKIRSAILALSPDQPSQAHILALYGAKKFIATKASNYREIEQIARKRELLG